ncbi:hypothetical protein Gogos_020876 [Gossypium gossypioides]|uniref:Uncharacterized protein n=1 Tax=Gossypium gossypioides TaxID=34282 RepID=A0A7J9D1T0_GOSGO|nr:hypothetical protein [Gossypium gossypioides]
MTYQEIEWRAPWMIRSTVLIGFSGHLWVFLIGIWIEELKKESTPFATKDKPAIKLLEVAQAHYRKFIKLMRRKKKNGE